MKSVKAFLLVSFFLVVSCSAFAQEGDVKVLDEVIARVNTEVILRSAFDRQLEDFIAEMRQRGMEVTELEKKVAEIKPQIIDNLIDQQLLTQRAKEISVEVEGQVNEQFVRLMKENNLTNLDELEQKMREVGIDIGEQKRLMRSRFMADAVLNREVYGDLYRKLTEGAKKEFYEKHKDWFSTPGEVELSRLFIRKPSNPLLQQQALTKAKDIVTQIQGGGDFKAFVMSKSEDPREVVIKSGYIGWVPMPQLSNEIRGAVEKLEIGKITEPILVEGGYAIFNVNARKEPVVKPFETDEVKGAVTQRLVMEKGEDAVKEYLAHLREDAFIEIDAKYQVPGLKTTSANIKRTPFSEESDKERNKRLKREKKEKEKQNKEAAKAKEAAQK
jgi:peptidyl-prolyl cis-trans isomerase SurA